MVALEARARDKGLLLNAADRKMVNGRLKNSPLCAF
jgi:hypothetical protein